MATAASRSFTLTAGHRRLGAKLIGAVLSLAFVLVFNFFLFRVRPTTRRQPQRSTDL